MCTLAVFVGASPVHPLVVAANRDEQLARPATPPRIWSGPVPFLAPRDELAGGSWLGLNEAGLFVGITNRSRAPRDPSRRSRGALVVDALAAPSADALHAQLGAIDPRAHNPFHLVYADRASAHLTWSDGEALHREDLGPGLHVVTERSFGGGDGARVDRIRGAWTRGDLPADALEAMVAEHAEDTFGAVCVHADAFGYGTRSSMILELGETWETTRMLWAEGKPCVTPFVDQAALVAALAR